MVFVSQNQSSPKGTVNIVMVGDARCGKTSLITTLVSSIFPETVPPVLQQVHVPPEDTKDNIALTIVDTSSDPEERSKVLQQVQNSDVTILVYSGDHPESFERVKTYWMKEINQVFKGPVVIVGNKIDLAPSDANADRAEDLQRQISPLLKQYKQIDACLECSAKLNMNVNEVFYFAQLAVIYPVFPLFDTHTHTLQPAFKVALKRIFRIFDSDRDGVLSDVELNNFQEHCFGARLKPDDVEGVKQVLQKEAYKYVTESGISLEGFMFINKLFIERTRTDVPWQILRNFGYDDKLQLRVNLRELELKRERDQSVELSKRGLAFLAATFHQFTDRGILGSADLDNMFSICPNPKSPWAPSRSNTDHPDLDLASTPSLRPEGMHYLGDFPRGVPTNMSNEVTLDGWLAQWSMTTRLQPHTSALYLRYLGFTDNIQEALTVTRRRRVEDRENDLQRSVVRAFVFGAAGVGKSSLLDVLAKKKVIASDSQGGVVAGNPATKPESSGKGALSDENNVSEQHAYARSACAMVQSRVKKGQDRGSYLVMTEVQATAFHAKEALNDMVDCDLAIMMFDANNPASVEYLKALQERIPETVPCVYLANKIDTVPTDDQLEATPPAMSLAGSLCAMYNLADPEPIMLAPSSGLQMRKLERLFELLMTIALRPGAARPISDARRAALTRSRILKSVLRISAVVATFSLSGYMFYKYVLNPQQAPQERYDDRYRRPASSPTGTGSGLRNSSMSAVQ